MLLTLKEDVTLPNGITIRINSELEIVSNYHETDCYHAIKYNNSIYYLSVHCFKSTASKKELVHN